MDGFDQDAFNARYDGLSSVLEALNQWKDATEHRTRLRRRLKAAGDAAEEAELARQLAELSGRALTGDEVKSLRDVAVIREKGLAKALSRRKKPETVSAVRSLAERFVADGFLAVMKHAASRGGDFLFRQLQGEWAERVSLSVNDWLPDYHLVRFGPSGAAVPEDEGYERTVGAFRLISLVEGKRPDLVAFHRDVWNDLGADERRCVGTWPERVLDGDDERLLQQISFAVEVKLSAQHFGNRRAYWKERGDERRAALSVPIKVEEWPATREWTKERGKPILFFLVTFDELHCMSFDRMQRAAHVGYLYRKAEPRDAFIDTKSGARGQSENARKRLYKFRLFDEAHRCGTVKWPVCSTPVIRPLRGGSVAAYIRYDPARLESFDDGVLRRELEHERWTAALEASVPKGRLPTDTDPADDSDEAGDGDGPAAGQPAA